MLKSRRPKSRRPKSRRPKSRSRVKVFKYNKFLIYD